MSGLLYEKYISSEPEDVQEFSLVADDDLESEVTEDGKFFRIIVFFFITIIKYLIILKIMLNLK